MRLVIYSIIAGLLIGFGVGRAYSGQNILDGKVEVAINMCEVDDLYNLKHGGKNRFCIVYLDPKQPGKRWFAIYGEGGKGVLESIVEGDDATVTWRRVWRNGIEI